MTFSLAVEKSAVIDAFSVFNVNKSQHEPTDLKLPDFFVLVGILQSPMLNCPHTFIFHTNKLIQEPTDLESLNIF